MFISIQVSKHNLGNCLLCLSCNMQGTRVTKKESGSRARGHVLLVPDRPTCVTILSLGM